MLRNLRAKSCIFVDEPRFNKRRRTVVKYLHSMIRVSDPASTVAFFELIGLKEVRRFDSEQGRFTLIFLAAPGQEGLAEVELTYNWPPEDGSAAEAYDGGRNFGHLAYRVDDIYETCQRLKDAGHTIHRPPRDGHMAFVKSPDGISVELLQDGSLPPREPWASMENTGSW
jgi:lactoylglutathione lyase